MKKIMVGIAMAACLTIGFAICGSGDFFSSDSIAGVTVEKAIVAQSAPDAPVLSKQPAQDGSIYSWTTILYLTSVVIGIVAFRRNTYA